MSAQERVDALISDQQQLASDLADQASQLVASAATALSGAFFTKGLPEGPDGFLRFLYEGPERPNYPERRGISRRPFPERPLFSLPNNVLSNASNLPGAPLIKATQFDDKEPPTDVQEFFKEVPDVATDLRQIPIPSIGEYEPAPLIEVTIPTRTTEAEIPIFDSPRPGSLEDPPRDLDQRFKQEYDDSITELRAACDIFVQRFMDYHFPNYRDQVAQLDQHYKDITNGDKTVWHKVEQAMFDRRRVRAEAERSRVDTEIRRGLGRTGSAVMLTVNTQLARAEQAHVDANVAAAYEVAEQQNQREVNHLEFALNSVNGYRDLAVRSWLDYRRVLLEENQFALAFANQTLQYVIESYNLLVTKFNADLELYKVDAQVWETRVRYAFIDLELLERELRVAELQEGINTTRVQRLQAQIESDRVQIQLYAEQLRALAIEIENRKLPLDVFEAQINAHRVYLEGKQVETQIYQALLQGDRTQIEADLARVRVYESEISAFKARLDTETSINESRSLYNRVLGDIYNTDLQAWTADINADVADINADNSIRDSQIREYLADVEAELKELDINSRNQWTEADIRYKYDQMAVNRQIELIKQRSTDAAALARVNVEGSRILQGLAQAALVSSGAQANEIHQTTTTE